MAPFLVFLTFVLTSSIALPFLNDIFSFKIMNSIDQFLGLICHQRPDRSLLVAGLHMHLCSRCFSFYLTSFILLILFIFNRQFIVKKQVVFYALLLPLIVDGTTQLFGFRESTNLLRCITGSLASISVSPIIYLKYHELIHAVPGFTTKVKI